MGFTALSICVKLGFGPRAIRTEAHRPAYVVSLLPFLLRPEPKPDQHRRGRDGVSSSAHLPVGAVHRKFRAEALTALRLQLPQPSAVARVALASRPPEPVIPWTDRFRFSPIRVANDRAARFSSSPRLRCLNIR